MLALDNIQWIRENSEEDVIADASRISLPELRSGKRKFYIFSVNKRVDDTAGVKKMYHQARLTKPEPLPGTTLMRVDPDDPGSCTILWTLPQSESYGSVQGRETIWQPVRLRLRTEVLARPREHDAEGKDDPSEDVRFATSTEGLDNKKPERSSTPWPRRDLVDETLIHLAGRGVFRQ